MNIIFFGTPRYVVPVLNKIYKTYRTKTGESPIVAVVTQEPKPVGRKQTLKYSAVDEWAHKKDIPIHFDPLDVVRLYPRVELGVLASYGAIIPKTVIEHFKYGILNIHPSLLPNWRGASPVQASIIAGGPVGATIMKLDEKLDHGPIVTQFKDELLPEDTTQSLRNRLFERSAEVLVKLVPAYIAGKVNIKKQNHEEATFAKQIKRDDAFIPGKFLSKALQGLNPSRGSAPNEWDVPFMKDFTTNYSPSTIHRFIRAMQPWPQAWTTVRLNKDDEETKRLKLLESHLDQSTINNQQLIIKMVQLEGKNPVSWEQFKDGYPESKF